MENKFYPKTLVVSNNAFSTTSNNGKTLSSFFRGFPREKVAQLYFNKELPDNDYFNNYFRITDLDMVNCLFKFKPPGKIVRSVGDDMNIGYTLSQLGAIIRCSELARILREFCWSRNKWKTQFLKQWLRCFSPEVIFFCAGDSGFAYEIANYIRNAFNAKLVVYITDDYVLPRKSLSPWWWIRRNMLYSKMKRVIESADLFVTISPEMREIYRELFGVDSILAMNISEPIEKTNSKGITNQRREIVMVYAGGLHYNRHKTLGLLAKSIQRYNSKGNKKVFLKIFSGSKVTRNIKKELNIEGASHLFGFLDEKNLKKELNNCDIPVHVESFDQSSIESTRLSISTKIPEYLSLGKPILAIGPSNVSSLKYLKDSAYCIVRPENVYSDLKNLLEDHSLKKALGEKAYSMYRRNHLPSIVSKRLVRAIVKTMSQ